MAVTPSEDAQTADQGGISMLNLDKGFFPVTPPAEAEHEARDLAASLEPIDANSPPLVAVIGVGYVGTHLVEVFSRAYNTLGFDVSERRVQDLKQTFAANKRVALTSSPRDLHAATHYLISVPTLLLPDKSVDTSYLRSALKTVAAHARPGSTIVIESSVAIGMTRQLLGDLAKLRGYFAGMSPEVSSNAGVVDILLMKPRNSASTQAALSLQHTPSPRSFQASTTSCRARLRESSSSTQLSLIRSCL